MTKRNRIEKQQYVPAEPIVPFVEVQRTGLAKYSIRLTTVVNLPYTNIFGKTRMKRGYWEASVNNWTSRGSKAHAHAYAKRILTRYLRRIGYQTEAVIRFVGKV